MTIEIDTFLAQFSREAREIALCLRELVLDVFPRAIEMVDAKSGIIAYGYSRTYKSLIFTIQPHMKHVNLMFSKGTSLSDPANLLEGTGRQARHVKFKSEEQIQNPALRILLKDALKLDYT